MRFDMAEQMKSYTSLGGSIVAKLRTYANLARGVRSADPQRGVDHLIATCSAAQRVFEEQTGRSIDGIRALEIGPGTSTAQMLYFAQKCDVTGIDLDVIPTGLNPLTYWRVLRVNGPDRFIKTIGKKLLSRDKEFRRTLASRLGVGQLRRPTVMCMDATRMSFPDDTFDFIYSFDVFEHLPDPAAVFRQARRVLKPGGVIFTSLHLFTCESGFHDLRLIAGRHEGIAYWAHLRSKHQHEVQSSAYLNKLSLKQWHEIFDQELSGSATTYRRDDDLRDELSSIRAQGELAEFSDDELLASRVVNVWRKPA